MSNVDKQAVKEITKAHKTDIRVMHDSITIYLRDFKDFLIKEGRSEMDEDVINTLIEAVKYLKAYKRLVFKKLNDLTTSLLHEEPTQELTSDGYNKVKTIVSEHYDDLANAIVVSLCNQIRGGAAMILKTDHQIKSTIEEVVYGVLDEDLVNILQEMDEAVVTVETVSIDELKKENMRLKAELDAYKKAIADVKKKFC